MRKRARLAGSSGGPDDTIAPLAPTLSERDRHGQTASPSPRTRPEAAPDAARTRPRAPSKELHVFPNPAPERDYVIQFQVPEFTCLCPLTGQPDFAHFTIDIVADKLCVELKSLKMYFWSYRNEGAFHEKVTNAILDDIVEATRPALHPHHRQVVRARRHLHQRGGRAPQEGLEAGTGGEPAGSRIAARPGLMPA